MSYTASDYSECPGFLRDYLYYLLTIKGRSKLTVEGYFIDLRTFFRFLKKFKGLVPDETPLEEISIHDVPLSLAAEATLSDVYEFLNYTYTEKTNNARTRARKVSALRGLYKYLTNNVGLIQANPVEKLELPLAHMIPELTANILIPVLMLIYLFALDMRIALISLVTIPIGIICYMGMMKDYEKRYNRVLTAGKNMDAAIVEYINGIEVIKTFNQGTASYVKYAAAVKENENAKATWFRATNIFYVAGISIMPSCLLGVLPLGAYLYMRESIEAPVLVACVILALGLVKPLIQALQYTDSLAMVDSTVKEIASLFEERIKVATDVAAYKRIT